MRNGWNGLRRTALVAFSAVISLPAIAAQGEQTAQGAQRFLATMAKNLTTQVDFVDAAGRTNYVTGKYTGSVKRIKGGAFGKPKETTETLPERFVDKQVTGVRASVLEAIDAQGRPNECATRITAVTAPHYDNFETDAESDDGSFSFLITSTAEYWKYEPLTKFMNPAQVIDWSTAKVNRSPQGSVTVTSKGQAFPTIHLTYMPGDPDLADRIEYAMKFLVMSCDQSAATGF